MSTQAVSELRLRRIEDMKARQLNQHSSATSAFCARSRSEFNRTSKSNGASSPTAFCQ